MDAFDALGYRYWQARAQLDLAERLAGHGDPARAAAVAAHSAAVFADLGTAAMSARASVLVGAEVLHAS